MVMVDLVPIARPPKLKDWWTLRMLEVEMKKDSRQTHSVGRQLEAEPEGCCAFNHVELLMERTDGTVEELERSQ
jgi:hypothetical protein